MARVLNGLDCRQSALDRSFVHLGERMSGETTRTWLRGAVVAVPTPFHDDFSLDLDSLRHNIEIIIERGVRTGDGVLLVAGAGGEFPTLTHDERVAVMRASVEAAAGRAPTVTSIQHTD